MARIVMKFGGTSVANLDRIRHVASLVAEEAKGGNEVAVVVSAMSGETNRLVGLVDALDADSDKGTAIEDEYDSIVASGEQVTSISDDGRISTLGRGGSDTSAVAIAVALKAETMEERVVSGVAYSRDESQITLLRLKDQPGMVAKVCKAMADGNVIVDMIVQGISKSDSAANLTFTVGKRDLDKALKALEGAKSEIGFEAVKSDSDVTKVSVVGIGMRSHTGVAQTMFEALAERNINVKVIATSEIKISVLIDAEYTELAVRALHSAFELDKATKPAVSAP